MGEFDILIAATCIKTGHILVTNDHDFDPPGKLTRVRY